MLAAAQDEIEERDKAILELYEKYQEAIKDNDKEEDDIKSISENDSTPVDRAKLKKKNKTRSKEIEPENEEKADYSLDKSEHSNKN